MQITIILMETASRLQAVLSCELLRSETVLTGTLEVSMISGRPAPRSILGASATALAARIETRKGVAESSRL